MRSARATLPPRTKKSCTVRPLERPSYKREECEWDSSRDTLSYREAQKSLQRLIELQDDLYYKDLKVPKLLGPTKEYRLVRLPDDIQNFKSINKDISLLIQNIESVDQPVVMKPLPSPHSVDNGPTSIERLANIYRIDIRDISESLNNKKHSSRVEVQSISRKLEKPLLKGRDTALEWPAKPRRRDAKRSRFGNVPLFT